MAASGPFVAERVAGPCRGTSTIASGVSPMIAKPMFSLYRRMPGPLVAVIVLGLLLLLFDRSAVIGALVRPEVVLALVILDLLVVTLQPVLARARPARRSGVWGRAWCVMRGRGGGGWEGGGGGGGGVAGGGGGKPKTKNKGGAKGHGGGG